MTVPYFDFNMIEFFDKILISFNFLILFSIQSVLASENSFGTLHTLQSFKKWAAHEEKIVEHLYKRLAMIRKERKLINGYLSDYSESSEKALENVYEPKLTPEKRGEVIGSSYVLGHRMICRYTTNIYQLKSYLKSENYQENLGEIKNVLGLVQNNCEENMNSSNFSDNCTESEIWPDQMDIYLSVQGFFHIQEAYKFSAEKLHKGLTFDTSFGGSLNARQCSEIGIAALRNNYTYMSIQWFELAKKLILTKQDDSISVDFVTMMLNAAIDHHDHCIESCQGKIDDDNFSMCFYLNYNYTKEGEPESSRVTYQAFISNKTEKVDNEFDGESDFKYSHLCQGNVLQSTQTKATLKCYYEKKRHPYLYINPVKVEHLSESPEIFQFYDFVSQKDITTFKEIGAPHLTLSALVGKAVTEESTRYRSSAGCFMPRKPAEKVRKLVEMVSGLNLLHTSELQLVEYIYGRYYHYHSDAFSELTSPFSKFMGNRLATILYYLDTPRDGGLTPFLSAGISAYQVPGSAILWYNMFRNGTERQDVDHAACPVIHGNKIIMNHWIRYNGNFLNHKCSLNQYE